jgi:hypothetical protein
MFQFPFGPFYSAVCFVTKGSFTKIMAKTDNKGDLLKTASFQPKFFVVAFCH